MYCNENEVCYNNICCRGSSSVVEHHLAMVGVAGSNPVFRSKTKAHGGELFFVPKINLSFLAKYLAMKNAFAIIITVVRK
jgi:hypothetical protein